MDATAGRYEDEVLRRLHEVARAAREVPVDSQPERLRDALASLVALDMLSTGTHTMPFADVGYTPGMPPSS